MAISMSHPDPSSPAAVAGATFSTSRKGYSPDEVRQFLRNVADELTRRQEHERALERELRELQQRQAAVPVELDEETVTTMLGEETARIVQTAREAANQTRARAEEQAARLLRDASEDAARAREAAELEAARRRHDASTDAEAELDMAKQQGREMVHEAREYRERVLGELARRRELARQQIEQLVHGRDRLLQAFERARLAAVDVVAELGSLGDEPPEFVNLAPTTGPVPVMLPNTPQPIPRQAPAEPYDGSVDEMADSQAEPAVESAVPEADASSEGAAADPDGEEDPVPPLDDSEPAIGDSLAGDAETGDAETGDAETGDGGDLVHLPERADPSEDTGGDDREEADDQPHASGESSAPREPATNVYSLFPPSPDPEPAERSEKVDDLFAKLRAASAEMVARATTAAAAAPPAPSADDEDATRELDVASPFGQRDEVLVPLILSMARKLKRVLADEQNEVLDTLRRKEPVRSLDVLVPWEGDHADRYLKAIAEEIDKAALAGASALSGASRPEMRAELRAANVKLHVHETFVGGVLAPLRERLDTGVARADGDNAALADTARSVYREWKSQHIDDHVDDLARMAYGRGAFAVLAPGVKVCWIVDPDGPACADAEDNSLAGPVPASDTFPTGHQFPPAHGGCRCLLALAPPSP